MWTESYQSNKTIMDQIEPNGTKVDKIGPNKTKWTE